MLRDQDPDEEPNSELSESETSWLSEDPPVTHGPDDAAPGASPMPNCPGKEAAAKTTY